MNELVYVEWEDSALVNAQIPLKDAEAWKAVPVRTAGFLVYEDDDRIVVAQDVFPSEDDDVRGVEVIPMINVNKITKAGVGYVEAE